MDNDPIRVPPDLTGESLLDRYVARLIDQLLPLGDTANLGFAYWLVFWLIWIGYGTLIESSPWQATPGKRWMGLRVYNSRGSRLWPLQAAGRNLVKDGPFLVLGAISGGQILSIVWLGAHLAVVNRSPVHQAIHDRILRTWVAVPKQ